MATVSKRFSSIFWFFRRLVGAVGVEIHQHEVLQQAAISGRGNMLAFIQWQLVQA